MSGREATRREDHAAVEANAAALQGRAASPLAALFASHVLQDGELVLLILKPSLWFIVLSGLRFIAVVLILMILATLFDAHLPGRNRNYQELGIVIIAGRVVWSMLQWMGRLYILTDLRVVRLSGVFNVEIFDCPLRKLTRTRVVRSMRERISRTGTIELNCVHAATSMSYWNTIDRPIEVHEQIVAAINRAHSGGSTASLQ